MRIRVLPSRKRKFINITLYLIAIAFTATNLELVIGFNPAEPTTILQNQIVALTANIEPDYVIPAIQENIETLPYKPEEPPEGMLPVLAVDMHPNSGWGLWEASEGVFVRNSTNLTVDVASLFNQPLNLAPVRAGGPQVLIIHAHSSEAFMPTASHFYNPSDPMRTQDMNHTVMRVGLEMKQVLNDMGIETIQCRHVHDYPMYNGSYRRALECIERYLRQHPSIQVVIDVHRDSMQRPDGTRLKNVTNINGEEVAQVMILSGTNASGLYHPNWRENLKLAMHWQSQMNADSPRLTRAIELREERFNMHATKGSLLIEVGSTGHTLEEAIRGGRLAAQALGRVLLRI